MPRIYDSSAITQRRRDLAQAGSFITRIQSSTPQTSYGPLQGNYDASVMNSVKMGQPKDFYRNNGCVIISNGCPCPPITINEITSGPNPPLILAPGPVRNIQLRYGSVIVTWEAPDPNTGGTPTSYTVTASASGQTTITVPDVTALTYPFATTDLTSGVVYDITVIGVNSAGGGAAYDGSNPTIDAPYIKPTYTSNTLTSTPTQIGITISYTSYTAFLPTTGTLFNPAGTQIGTGDATATTFTIISGLSPETVYTNCYFRLTAGTDTSSNSDTFSFTTLPFKVGPVPSITSVYGTTTNGVDVTWTAPTTGGTPTSYTISAIPQSGSSVIVNNITALTYSFAVSALTSGTQYLITVMGVNSAGNGAAYSGTPSTIYAPFAAPISILSNPLSTTSVNITFTPYTDFVITGATIVIPGATPTSISVSDNNTVIIGGGLSSATTYNNCTIRLTGNSGNTSNISAFFQIKTNSVAPGVPTNVVPAPQSAVCTLAAYSGFTGPITEVIASGYIGSSPYAPLSVSYSAGNPTFTINSLDFNTLYTVKIQIGNGTYISEFSGDFSVQTLFQPEPQIQFIGVESVSWTTALSKIQPYSFNDGNPPPNNSTVTYTPDGTLPSSFTQDVGFDLVEITALLDPGTTYIGASPSLTLTVTNGSQTSPSANFPQFTTNSANASAPTIHTSSVGQNSITYEIYISSYSWTPSASYVTAKKSGTLQKLLLASSYSPPIFYTDPAIVSVTGLDSGATYEEVRLALTDNTINFTNFVDPGNFTTQYSAPQNIQIPNSGRNTTSVKITFDYYSSFTISPGNSTISDGTNTLSIDTNPGTYDNTFITVTNLLLGTTYSGYYLTLQDANGLTAVAVLVPDIIPAYPGPNVDQNSISTGENYVTIPYTQYTSFPNSITSGTLYDSNGSSFGSLSNVSDTQLQINGLSDNTSYTNCYITLTDSGGNTSQQSITFNFTTSSPPPSYPSPDITDITYNGTNATITYNDYSQESGSFGTPNGGTLYLNNGAYNVSATSADNTTMVVDISGASLSTIYPNSYITVTNSSQTSNGSNSQTIITAPGNIQVTPHNLAASINYTAYDNTTISNVFITDVSDSNITYSSQSILNGSFIMTGPNGGNAYLNPGTTYNVKFYVQTDAGNSLESTISFTTTDSFPAVDIPIIPTQSYPYVTSTYDSMSSSVGVTFTFTSTYNAFYPFTPDNGELRNDMGTTQGNLASVSINSVTINNIIPLSTTFSGYTLNINYGPYVSFYSSGTAFSFTTYPAPTGVQQINDPVNPTPPNQVDISFSYYDTSASFNNAILILNDGTNYGTNSINYSGGSGTFSISGIPSVDSTTAYIVLYNSGLYAHLPSDVFPVTITSP
jgi:hypothetical protein